MRIPNVGLGGVARQSRFMPGWWILPGLMLGAVAWTTVIWLVFTR